MSEFQGHKKVRLTTDLPDAPVLAEVDGQRFGQVLTNLIHNAIKFSEPEREVMVRLKASAEDANTAPAQASACGFAR